MRFMSRHITVYIAIRCPGVGVVLVIVRNHERPWVRHCGSCLAVCLRLHSRFYAIVLYQVLQCERIRRFVLIYQVPGRVRIVIRAVEVHAVFFCVADVL